MLAFLVRPDRWEALRSFVYASVLTLPLYGGLLEGFWNGQTVGKRLVGVEVVDETGREPSAGQAFLRNLPAVVLFSWVTAAVALAAMATTDYRQRLFDGATDAYVVGIRHQGDRVSVPNEVANRY